jgi:hypothetical protein
MSQPDFPVSDALVSPAQNPAFQAKAILRDLEKLTSSSTHWRSLTPLDSPKKPVAREKSIVVHLS